MDAAARKEQAPEVALATLRRVLIAVFLFGLLGTGVELLLLEHTDGIWQLAPLLVVGMSFLVLGWYGVARSASALRVFQGTMILFLLSGAAGLLLHFKGNVEFELEMYPSRSGTELFWEAMKGATPALSPGTMLLLGLLGLAYTYRHPALIGAAKDNPRNNGD